MGRYITRLIFVIVFIHLLIVIIIITVLYNKYKHTKYVADQFIKKLENTIPKFSKREHVYKTLTWKRSLSSSSNITHEFDTELAVLLSKYNMCAYNITNKYRKRLDLNTNVVRKLGSNGYMFRVSERRQTYILAYRGTVTGSDVAADIDFSQKEKYGGMVHEGFYDMWKKEFDLSKNEFRPGDTIYVTGHSLGAAIATLTSYKLAKILDKCNVICYLYSPPRIGDSIFMHKYAERVPNHWAIINKVDMIPNMPIGAAINLDGVWLYDDYVRVKYIDIQMGSIMENHHLDTYLSGLTNKHTVKSIWNHM